MSNLYHSNCYTSLQTTITKFYIAEPKTPLDNQLQYKSHIVRNLFLSRHNKPEELRKFGHPKSPQQDVAVENQQAKSQSKIEVNLTQNYYITEKQFEGHTTTKRNSRNKEYMPQREHVENPDD